jgi:hypothetical protein
MSAPVTYHLALRAAFRDDADGPERSAAREPPPGHPERLVTDMPPSAAESRLWAELTDLGT